MILCLCERVRDRKKKDTEGQRRNIHTQKKKTQKDRKKKGQRGMRLLCHGLFIAFLYEKLFLSFNLRQHSNNDLNNEMTLPLLAVFF